MVVIKEHYESPAVEVVEVKMEINILSVGTEDYNYGGLDG